MVEPFLKMYSSARIGRLFNMTQLGPGSFTAQYCLFLGRLFGAVLLVYFCWDRLWVYRSLLRVSRLGMLFSLYGIVSMLVHPCNCILFEGGVLIIKYATGSAWAGAWLLVVVLDAFLVYVFLSSKTSSY